MLSGRVTIPHHSQILLLLVVVANSVVVAIGGRCGGSHRGGSFGLGKVR
jgi:hypothetical protein